MKSQDERLGSLLAFTDIALILSTYGVLFAYSYLIEPVNTNTWIVCTFFVGIKILICGIADITGIGKSALVSALFVIIADGIIVLINQLMAFGLSSRMLLVMAGVDVIAVLIFVLIWKSLGRNSYKPLNTTPETDWVYDDDITAKSDQELPNPNKNLIRDNSPEKIGTQNVFQFNAENNTSSLNEESKDFFSTFDREPISDDSSINFESITDEIPIDEIESELQKEEFVDLFTFEEVPQESEIIFESEPQTVISLNQAFDEEPPVFETGYSEETISEVALNTDIEEYQEDSSVEEEIISVPEESIINAPEEESPEAVIEETVTEEEPPEVSEPIQEAAVLAEVLPEIEETEEEITEMETPEVEEAVEEEEELTLDDIIPHLSQETEEIVEEEPLKEPLFIDSVILYNSITNSTLGFNKRFNVIPANISEEGLNALRDDVKEETIRLSNNLNTLFEAYNESLDEREKSKSINILPALPAESTLNTSDRYLRNQIKDLIEAEFVSEDIVHNIIALANKLSNRSYSIDVAQDNIKERLELEKQRELERIRIEQEKAQKEEEERKAREERRKAEQQRVRAQKQQQKLAQEESKPALKTNEVLLQNDDMDIIIDSADLELLKEFLAQQKNNK